MATILWPVLFGICFAALVSLHFWWRTRFSDAQRAWKNEVAALSCAQRQGAQQVQVQQEAIFESMAEGLLLLDSGGRILIANRAFNELFNILGDIRTKTIIEVLRLHEVAEVASRISAQEQVLGHELRLTVPRERWLEVNGAAIVGSDGKRTGTILMFHDLTRLKQLENVRQEFVANVSHELRTPLSLIKGYVETLLDGAADDRELRNKFLRTIESNAERLHFLIEDLLTISELESGRIKLHLESLNLRDAVDEVIADLRSRAEARKMTLLNEVPSVQVRADANRLEQVFSNLIDNAIKYGRPGGRMVAGGALDQDGQMQVFIQDDGPGIPQESLERVFERFYRVDKGRAREQGGTGLGLSIVKHIVQSHQGRVWASSRLGHGTTFFFTLPTEPGPTHDQQSQKQKT